MERVVLGFEGINGAGKSQVIDGLRAELESVPEDRVEVVKIGGLGSGRRMDCLRAILGNREEKLLRHELTPRERRDYERDRIFRLAYRYQVSRYLASNAKASTHVLFDRTPLMSWAYTAAAFPDSPYIEEVRNEAIEHTAKLGLRCVYVLEVRPATAYGRILARHVKAEQAPGTIDSFVKNLRAPEHVVRAAREIALSLLADSQCAPKPFCIWDYMPYDDVLRQLETYRAVVAESARLLGFHWRRVDAEATVESVIREVRATFR